MGTLARLFKGGKKKRSHLHSKMSQLKATEGSAFPECGVHPHFSDTLFLLHFCHAALSAQLTELIKTQTKDSFLITSSMRHKKRCFFRKLCHASYCIMNSVRNKVFAERRFSKCFLALKKSLPFMCSPQPRINTEKR